MGVIGKSQNETKMSKVFVNIWGGDGGKSRTGSNYKPIEKNHIKQEKQSVIVRVTHFLR